MSYVGKIKYKVMRIFSKSPETQILRLQRANRQLPILEFSDSLIIPSCVEELCTKLKRVESHYEWTISIKSTKTCAYSDGSSEGYDAEICGATVVLLVAVTGALT